MPEIDTDKVLPVCDGLSFEQRDADLARIKPLVEAALEVNRTWLVKAATEKAATADNITAHVKLFLALEALGLLAEAGEAQP